MSQTATLPESYFYGWQGLYWGIAESARATLKKSKGSRCLNKDKNYREIPDSQIKSRIQWVKYNETEMKAVILQACATLTNSVPTAQLQQGSQLVCAPVSEIARGDTDCKLNNGVIKELLHPVVVTLWQQ